MDTVNKLPVAVPLDADAMDRRYEQQKKDMKCREVNGVVLCG